MVRSRASAIPGSRRRARLGKRTLARSCGVRLRHDRTVHQVIATKSLGASSPAGGMSSGVLRIWRARVAVALPSTVTSYEQIAERPASAPEAATIPCSVEAQGRRPSRLARGRGRYRRNYRGVQSSTCSRATRAMVRGDRRRSRSALMLGPSAGCKSAARRRRPGVGESPIMAARVGIRRWSARHRRSSGVSSCRSM